jgi:tRNA pseudouridine55 synthase
MVGDPAATTDGFLLFDKPLGWTSNQALQRIRKRVEPRVRGGYLGTLDPLATGLLPVALGTATRFLPYFMASPKLYRVEVTLGQQTSTGDCEGDIRAHGPVPNLDFDEMGAGLAGRIGASLQVPPMYSAIKQNGVPLYRLARRQLDVERSPRPIEVFRVSLLDWTPPTARFELECGPGVYVRSWVEDWARSLGTVGHVSALRRLRVGRFGEGDLVGWEDLESIRDRLRSADQALLHLPRLELAPSEASRIIRGQRVVGFGLVPWGPVRLYDRRGAFLGLGAGSGPDGLKALRLCPTGETAGGADAATASRETGESPGPLCEKTARE